MPNPTNNLDTATSADEGTWQPDLDPDLSADLEQGHDDLSHLPLTLDPALNWQPAALPATAGESVAVEEYHADAAQELAMRSRPTAVELEHTGRPFNPPAQANNPGDPSLGIVLSGIGLFISIFLFHQAGIIVFILALLAIWLFRTLNQGVQ